MAIRITRPSLITTDDVGRCMSTAPAPVPTSSREPIAALRQALYQRQRPRDKRLTVNHWAGQKVPMLEGRQFKIQRSK